MNFHLEKNDSQSGGGEFEGIRDAFEISSRPFEFSDGNDCSGFTHYDSAGSGASTNHGWVGAEPLSVRIVGRSRRKASGLRVNSEWKHVVRHGDETDQILLTSTPFEKTTTSVVFWQHFLVLIPESKVGLNMERYCLRMLTRLTWSQASLIG